MGLISGIRDKMMPAGVSPMQKDFSKELLKQQKSATFADKSLKSSS